MRKLVFAAATALLALTASANAATIKPISKGRSLVLTGTIVMGDAQRLYETYIASCNRYGRCPERIFLNSDGGQVLAAYEIADWIIELRNAGYSLDTVVGAADTCMSACFIIFVVGTKHVVFPTSIIGVHSVGMLGQDGSYAENVGTSAVTAEQARWLSELGVPDTIIVKLIATGPGEMAFLDGHDNYSGWFEVLPPTGKTYVPADRRTMFW